MAKYTFQGCKMATYTYSIADDFPDGLVNTEKLAAEIRNSAIVTSLDRVDTSGDALYIVFRAELSSGDKTILDGDTLGPAGGLIAANDATETVIVQPVQLTSGIGVPIPQDSDGNLITVVQPPLGTKINFMSVNWCDKTSWYEGSTKVTNETLSDSGNGLLFNSAHDFWVDMKHGKITFEDNLVAVNSGNWIVSVTSDDVAKTESPAGTTSGDYQVDYEAGSITFNSSQTGKTVKATYWYAVSGQFTIAPAPGKKITLMRVEIQFTTDIELRDTMSFQAYGYAGVFAPQYVPVPFGFTDLIPLGSPFKYKSRDDFVNESNGAYPAVPAFGGDNWRGSTKDVITLPWTYLTRTEISSAAGMKIVITMENNTPHGGELATATFYTYETDA